MQGSRRAGAQRDVGPFGASGSPPGWLGVGLLRAVSTPSLDWRCSRLGSECAPLGLGGWEPEPGQSGRERDFGARPEAVAGRG